MSYVSPTHVVDANLLVRLADKSSPLQPVAKNALAHLFSHGFEVRTLPQSLFEFWVVATRPIAKNGLGLSVAQAQQELAAFKNTFPPIPDHYALVDCWENLVVKYGVHGKQAHDARYVASMQVWGLSYILTFDADFHRYSPEGIIVVDPRALGISPPSQKT